jgi:glycosyltransferase involved in cell wall biosynthesis
MRPLRLLVVVQRYGPEVRGGAEHAAREVAERLGAAGHHVEVLTTTARSYVDWSGDLPCGTEVIEGVTVHRLPVHPLRDPEVFNRLHHRAGSATAPVATDLQREWMQAQGPSVPALAAWLDAEAGRFDVAVFFTYLYATTTVGLPVAARHTATVLVPCAHDEPPLALHAFDRIAHLADALLFLTPEEAALVRGRFRLRTPHHVVGLGTELGVAPAGDVAAFRHAHGLDEVPYLLYVGRIDPSKGTSWLVDSFTVLKDSRPSPLRLVLLGEAVVPPVEHPDVVVVTDADDAARDAALAGAVALVHPSPFESFGMVVTEAWAAGTPVIAFGGNDVLRGHVERSGGGVLVHTAAELGAAAELLSSDRELRDGLGRAGREHVEERYAWPAVTGRWERALHRIAAAGPSRLPRPSPAPAPPLPPPSTSDTPAPPRALPSGPGRPDLADDLPPRWLALPLVGLLALVVAAALVGVTSAVLGWFTPAVVATGTVVLGLPATVVAIRAVPRWSSSRGSHAAAALVVAAAVAITAWNGANHGEHLVADRDPGVYLTTARHLVDDGDLLVPGPVGPFADAPGIAPNGVGFSPIRGDGTLEPQFPHLTPVLLAIGGWVGELGLFLVTPLEAGLGLVLVYAWAGAVVGPRWAAPAAVTAGLTMPFMVFARDAYSEPITTVLAFGGLWLLHLAHRSGRLSLWLLGGLAIGATNMARVDSYLYLAPIALALALAIRLAPSERRRDTALGALWCGLGVAVTSAVALWDTITLTGRYFEVGLGHRLPLMLGAAVVAGLVGWFGGPRLWARADVDAGAPELRPTPLLRGGLAAFVVGWAAFFAWAWWVRPDLPGLPPVAVEGVNILSYLPQAATLSVHWLSWYLGPVPLAAALAGLAWSVVRLGRGPRLEPAVVAGLGAVLVTLLLYLWSPNITPDHPWAMRRFSAVALPGLVVGISAAGRALWSASGSYRRTTVGPRRTAATWLGSGLALATVAASMVTVAAITWPTREARAQIPMRERMHEICDVLEPADAVLVPIDGILALMMSVPVGVWCDVPSAGGTVTLEAVDVARLAVEWDAEGRRLVVLSSSETPVFNTLRGAGIVTRAIDLEPIYPTAIEPTITSRPTEVVVDGRLGKGPDGEITFHLYVIDPERAGRLLRAERS